MGKKRFQSAYFPAVLFIVCFFLAACGGLTGGGDDGPSIPEGVASLAGGIFETIDLVFESESSDPTSGTYPAGMSVAWVTYDTVLKLTFTNYTPNTGVTVNGSVTLSKTSANPLTMTVVGSMTITGLEYSSASLNGTAVWPAGVADPGDADPVSVTGTFIVDGKSYSLAEVLAAAQDYDNGGGTTKPVLVTPLPAAFKTALGNYSQSFDDRAWRTGPAVEGSRWAEYNYMRFSIGPNGDVYAVYLSEVESNAGYINWYLSGGKQKLDFLDSSKTSILYSFTVLSYSANHLCLQAPWGGTTREWIFTAGAGNFSGLVLDPNDVVVAAPYNYYKPVAGATVEFGTYSGETFTPTGASTTTNAEGFFVFPGLSPTYDGQKAGIRVSAAGYTTYTMTSVESMAAGFFVNSSSQLYKTVLLSPP